MRYFYRFIAGLLVVLLLAGQVLAAQIPADNAEPKTELVQADTLPEAEPAASEETVPAVTEPDPLETDPNETDPEVTEPADPDPISTEPADPDPTATEEPPEEPTSFDAHHLLYINGTEDGCFMPLKVLSRAEMAQIFYNLGDYPNGEECFTDVPSDAWFAQAINAIAAAGLVEGVDNGKYFPYNAVTRVQFVTVLSRLAGISQTDYQMTFHDVPASHWGYQYVAIAQEMGWVDGFPDGTFRPDQSLTRAEAVTMLNRFLGRIPDEEAIRSCENIRFFPDVAPSDWFYYHVMEASMTHEAHMETDPASETWITVTPAEGQLANGFYCINGNFYVAVDNALVHTQQDGVCNGITYHCLGSNGVCKVDAKLVTLVNGKLVLTKNDTPLYAPGKYPTGFYLAGETICAAINGNLLNAAGNSTVNGLTVHCAGSSGACTVDTEVLILANGEIVFLKNGSLQGLPGTYSNGFHLRNNAIYVVETGHVVHTAKSGTVSGVSYTCEGSSGKCTVNASILTAADGNHYLVSGNKPVTSPGLHDLSSGLYYVNSNGTVLLSGSWNGLYFGSNGKYTSGNSQIDSYIENIVSSATNSSMTQVQKLRKCYDYVRYHVHYRSNNNHVPRGQNCSAWAETYMVRLINQGGYGNCYCYAAEMYYIARRLGYWQATAISGGVITSSYDHGWMEMTLNGTTYIFDPQLESTRSLASGTLYMITYSQAQSVGFPHFKP